MTKLKSFWAKRKDYNKIVKTFTLFDCRAFLFLWIHKFFQNSYTLNLLKTDKKCLYFK